MNEPLTYEAHFVRRRRADGQWDIEVSESLHDQHASSVPLKLVYGPIPTAVMSTIESDIRVYIERAVLPLLNQFKGELSE